MIILVDVDQTVADILPRWCELYNEDFNDSLTPDQVISWDIHLYTKPECDKKIYGYLKRDDFYTGVHPVEGALEAIDDLRGAGHTVLFVTSDPIPPNKIEWLRMWGFLALDGSQDWMFIVCRRKAFINGCVLIDDCFEQIKAFPGFAILFDQHHNRACEWPYRACGWAEVLADIKILEKMEALPDLFGIFS